MENRYDKYKDSGIAWIGVIPEHWEVRKGKNIFKLRNSKGNSNAILLAATQKYGMIPQSQIEGVVQVKQNTNLNTFKTVHKHDYVISLRSFQGGFEISEYEGVCSPAYQVFYSTIPCCNYFFKYLFKSYGFISQINAFTLGIREGKNIQYEDFSLMKLPFPVLHEQQAIADYLDRRCSEIDELIALQEEMITKLQSYKQSVITEAVTRGLDKNVPLKDSGIDWIGKVPEHWEITLFKRKITINNGKDYKNFSDAEIYPVIGSGGCFAYCSNYMYDGEALLLGRKGTIDKPLYVKGKFWAVDTMFYAIPHKDLHCKFSYYLALTFPFNLYSTSTSLPSLTQTDLGNIPVAFPSISEQQAIVDYLDQRCSEIDELIVLKQQKIEKLKEYKKSLIFECVTGKRKVS